MGSILCDKCNKEMMGEISIHKCKDKDIEDYTSYLRNQIENILDKEYRWHCAFRKILKKYLPNLYKTNFIIESNDIKALHPHVYPKTKNCIDEILNIELAESELICRIAELFQSKDRYWKNGKEPNRNNIEKLQDVYDVLIRLHKVKSWSLDEYGEKFDVSPKEFIRGV